MRITDYIGDSDWSDFDIILNDNIKLRKRLWYHLFLCFGCQPDIKLILDNNMTGVNIIDPKFKNLVRFKKVVSLKT